MYARLTLAFLIGSFLLPCAQAQNDEPEAVDPKLFQAYEVEQLAYRSYLDEFVKISSKVRAKKDVAEAVAKITALQKDYIATFNGKRFMADVPAAVITAFDKKYADAPQGKKFGPELFRLAGNDQFRPILDTMKGLEVLDPKLKPADSNAPPAQAGWTIEVVADPPAAELAAEDVRLPGHQDHLSAIAFSADGKWLATAADGDAEKIPRSIRIWNVQTGRAELLLRGPTEERKVAFQQLALTPDGGRLVSTDSNGDVQCWDLKQRTAGKPLHLIGHFNPFPLLVLSDDGGTAAVAVPHGVRALDVASGKVIAERPPVGNPAPITAVAISGDGKYVVSAIDTLGDPNRPTLEFWGLAEKKLLWRAGAERDFLALKITPDGKQVLAFDKSNTLFRFDAATGLADAGLKLEGHGEHIRFSRDGRLLLSFEYSAAALIDTTSGRKVRDVAVERFSHLRAGDLSADASQIALGGGKGLLRLIKSGRAATVAAPAKTLQLEGHTNKVRSIDYSPDGKRLISCGEDQTVRVWNPATGELLKTHDLAARSVRFTRDGKSVFIVRPHDYRGPSNLSVIDVQTGAIKLELGAGRKERPTGDELTGGAPLADGRYVALSQSGVSLWKASGEFIGLAQAEDSLLGRAAAVTADGKRLATDDLALWDLTSGKRLTAFELVSTRGMGGRVTAFSRDGKRLAAVEGGGAGSVLIWDAISGEKVKEFETKGRSPYSVAFSAQDDVLVTAGYMQLAFYNATSGNLIADVETRRHITEAVFSPDGRFVAECADEPVIQIWDAAPFAAPAKNAGRPAAPLPAEATAESFRKWSSADGRFQVEARLITAVGDSIKLERKDGKVLELSPSKLCAADQEYLAKRRSK